MCRVHLMVALLVALPAWASMSQAGEVTQYPAQPAPQATVPPPAAYAPSSPPNAANPYTTPPHYPAPPHSAYDPYTHGGAVVPHIQVAAVVEQGVLVAIQQEKVRIISSNTQHNEEPPAGTIYILCGSCEMGVNEGGQIFKCDQVKWVRSQGLRVTASQALYAQGKLVLACDKDEDVVVTRNLKAKRVIVDTKSMEINTPNAPGENRSTSEVVPEPPQD